MDNNARYDIPNGRFHFFRAVDMQHPDTPALPDHWSFSSVENSIAGMKMARS